MQVDTWHSGKHLLPGRLFALALAIFLSIHLALNLVLSGSFSPDDADQLIFSQSLAWGYYEQPPLYSWLTYLFLHLFGLTYLSYYLVKSLALAAEIAVGFYRAAPGPSINNGCVMICSRRPRSVSSSSLMHEALIQQGSPITTFTRAKGNAIANPSQLLNLR